MTGIQEHVVKYSLLSALANAPSGLIFGRLVRGDADEAKKGIRRLLTKGSRSALTLAAHVDTHPQRLRIVPVRIYSTEAKALLDLGAPPNLISPVLVSEFSPSPKPTVRRITVADGSDYCAWGA